MTRFILIILTIAILVGITEDRFPVVNDIFTDTCTSCGKAVAKGFTALADGFISYEKENALYPVLAP